MSALENAVREAQAFSNEAGRVVQITILPRVVCVDIMRGEQRVATCYGPRSDDAAEALLAALTRALSEQRDGGGHV
jgi:glycosyltransferase A (GT-A) superfamily protein (DUF2064 family)